MNRLRRAFAALTIGVVVLGGALVSADPASAASCPSTRVCFWQYSNYAGFTYTSYLPNPCLDIPDPMNNNATSIIAGSISGTQQFLRFYNAQGCQGSPVWWMYTGDSTASVSVAANNVITSFSRSATP